MSINDTTALTAAETLIESLTLDIDNMKRDLDLERKANTSKVELFAGFLQELIELEQTFPIGSNCAGTLKNVLKYYDETVVK